LRERFGLTITCGGLVHAVRRAARQAEPTYAALCDTIRGSPDVSPDETGWKVNAHLQWLWGFATPDTTVYSIQPGRGFEEAAAVLGADFDGVLVRDGWAPYRRFTWAVYQTCLAHLLRRCRTLIRDRDERRLAPRVQAILQQGLRTRDRWRRGALSAHGVAVARGHLENRLNRLIDQPGRRHIAQRFAAHLAIEYPAVFTFLLDPAIDATNWRAEQALRPHRRHPQSLWWQPHHTRRPHARGARQRPPHDSTAPGRCVSCLYHPPARADAYRRARAVTTGPVESPR
jgi:transposase